MRNGCRIYYPGLEDQSRALCYPRHKEDVEYILANTGAIHDAWVNERGLGVGASSAGTVNGTGFDAKDTPLQLWRRMRGIDPPKKVTYSMEYGHYLEPVVAELFCEQTGCIVDEGSVVDFFAIDKEKDFMRVSPDRFVWEKGTPVEKRTLENAVILECKSTSHPIDPDNIPLYWYCQVQYQMAVFGSKYCYLAWFNRMFRDSDQEPPFGYVKVKFNPGFWNVLRAKIENFWMCYINNVEPEAINGTDTKLKYPRSVDKKVKAVDEQLLDIIKEYLTAKEREAYYKELKENLQSDIQMVMGDCEILRHQDSNIITWKSSKDTTSFDEQAFKTDNPELYTAYCKPKAGARRFTPKIKLEDLTLNLIM